MIPLYPLRFRLLVRRYLWGNRRLETCLGKSLGPGNDYAESWEVADHGADQSIVDAGPLAGTALGDLVRLRAAELFGRCHPQANFPLLVKFLDAAQSLSVQVHPNDEQAARLDPPDLGKTEAWYILAADPGSRIYAGLRPGVEREQLAEAIAQGTCEKMLHCFEPKAGDCLFIPAGTVHALGAGLLVAEVQQSSDTTFRLYDWNRVGPDGKPRALARCAGPGRRRFPARAGRSGAAPAHRSALGQPPGRMREVRHGSLGLRPAADDRRRRPVPYCLRFARRGPHRARPAAVALAEGRNRAPARLPRQCQACAAAADGAAGRVFVAA